MIALPGVLLEELTWVEAEPILARDPVVVIPLGAAAKEHGPHLRLNTDRIMADYLARRVREQARVVIAPTIAYHFYPAFVEYPGSTTLRLETARDMVIDICRSLSAFGPRRFYILNTGVSTVRALEPAADLLAHDGIMLRNTDIPRLAADVERVIAQQAGGSHADEIETSMMLYIAPETVTMALAARDYTPGVGPLTRRRDGPGVYSPTGIYGDATLATREKGKHIVEAMVAGILRDIAALQAV